MAESTTLTYRMSAPNTPESARVARDMVAGLLYVTGHPGLVDVGRLLVSEVVSNVYLHTVVAQFKIVATVDRRRGRVLVSVEDRDVRGKPAGSEAAEVIDGEGVSGRGMSPVRECARAWGVTWHGGVEPSAKRVWFELQDESPRRRLGPAT